MKLSEIPEDRLLLKVDEVAQALSLGRSQTYELIQKGVIPAIRIGHSIRVNVTALREWVEVNTR